jgi:hypothetical protein
MPAQMITERHSVASQLAATFVVTEEERRTAIINRQKALKKLNRLQQSLLSNVSSHRTYVFCVQLAFLLTNAATEVYYSAPDEVRINSSFESSLNTVVESDDDGLLFQDAISEPITSSSETNVCSPNTSPNTENMDRAHTSTPSLLEGEENKDEEFISNTSDTTRLSISDPVAAASLARSELTQPPPPPSALLPSISAATHSLRGNLTRSGSTCRITPEEVEELRLMRVTSNNTVEKMILDEAEAVALDNANNAKLRPWNFEAYDLEYVTHFYDEETDTTCSVCREVSSRRLILSFR